MRSIVLAAVLCIAPLSALASDAPLEVAGDFHAQHGVIVADLAGGDRYKEISRADRSAVDAALARLSASLDGQASVSSLSGDARAAAERDLASVNALLASAAADSRVACRREKVLGSNRSQNNCLTVAERRRQREGAAASMDQGQTSSSGGQ